MSLEFNEPNEVKFTYKSLLVLDMAWRGYVGIVLAYDPKVKLWHGYIGVCSQETCSMPIATEEYDVKHIMDWGHRLTKWECVSFFNNQKAWDSDAKDWKY